MIDEHNFEINAEVSYLHDIYVIFSSLHVACYLLYVLICV